MWVKTLTSFNDHCLELSSQMNRKKKVKSTLLAKQKKANAKLHKSNKPKYISKAERAKMAEQASLEKAAESSVETSIEQSVETVSEQA